MTFIEIKEEDNINEFLESDKKIIEKKFRDKSIYILHYPEKKLISYGLTGGIDNYKKIMHYCDAQDGSSGSPILSLDNLKVI